MAEEWFARSLRRFRVGQRLAVLVDEAIRRGRLIEIRRGQPFPLVVELDGGERRLAAPFECAVLPQGTEPGAIERWLKRRGDPPPWLSTTKEA